MRLVAGYFVSQDLSWVALYPCYMDYFDGNLSQGAQKSQWEDTESNKEVKFF